MTEVRLEGASASEPTVLDGFSPFTVAAFSLEGSEPALVVRFSFEDVS